MTLRTTPPDDVELDDNGTCASHDGERIWIADKGDQAIVLTEAAWRALVQYGRRLGLVAGDSDS